LSLFGHEGLHKALVLALDELRAFMNPGQ